MIKRFSAWILIPIIFCACHTTKSIVRTSPSSPVTTTSESESAVVVDSVKSQQAAITSFDGKAKISFNDGKGETDFTANVRGKRDSILWFSITPALGIEVARVVIDKDSIRIIDRLNHRYLSYGFDYFKKYSSIPVSFDEMQSLIMGFPLLLNGKPFLLQRTDSVIRLTWSDSSLSNEIHLLKNYQLSQQTLLNGASGTMQLFCSGYQVQNAIPFSMWRKIELMHPSLVTITINFTKAKFNGPEQFPFDASKVE